MNGFLNESTTEAPETRAVEVDIAVYKEIEARRRSFNETHNDILRRIFRLTTAPNESVLAPAAGDAQPGDFMTKGVRFPAGTRLRMTHKGRIHDAIILEGAIAYDGDRFSSLSAASCQITGTGRNGWNDWEVLFPDAQEWVPAFSLRG